MKSRIKTQFRAYLFGHYDSRGGSVLIRADNVIVALQSYANDVTGVQGRDRQIAALVPHFQTVDGLGHVVLVKPTHKTSPVDYSKCDTAYECAQEFWNRQMDGFHDELERRAQCVFLDDEPFGELDADYGGAFRYGSVYSDGSHFVGVEPVTMIFWSKDRKAPTSEELWEHFGLEGDKRHLRVKPEEFGEDAFGLYLL